MLRQIARLTRRVPSAGPRALAIAVYGDATDVTVAAREAGHEGVACIDDAARALELYCDVWDDTRLPWAHRWCDGLLDFVLYMQEPDGRWLNFILDWDGTPNRTGRTSVAGGSFWQSRALLALTRASRSLDDDRIDAALARGLPHIVNAAGVAPDVRALQAAAALAMIERGDDRHPWREVLAGWCEEMMICRIGDVLMNAPAERGQPHLWGHIQEGILAAAGACLDRADFIAAALRSADRLYPDLVGSSFDLPRTQPYDVASTIYSLTRLAAVTGRTDYAGLAADARAWFDGRNPGREAVYDRKAGRVADGLDGNRISTRSGAESNIVGGQALLDDVISLAISLPNEGALPASVS